ncbi:type IV pilus biogenesis protein PilM [Paenibacillus protaetiae]|uniref:Pilus assembly protein PilM n=1 Tax=Paenibacillus protaetiae TaxID=2509456 RepID=A0A4P6EUT0_9BACL|nr:pilus assembly protein PilM [Paenibacillus protaetiae]QAY66426.1 hypothetical protein ET464_08395 [Paenibacillus protaetiae]
MDKPKLQLFSSNTRSLGVEITDEAVRLSEVQMVRKGRIQVTAYAQAGLPPGVIADGKLIDSVRLQAAIRSLLEERRIRTRRVHLAVPSQSVVIRTLQLPDVPRKEMRKLIDFEMKDNLQAAMDEPYFDFVKLPARTGAASEEQPDARLCEVLVIAAPLQVLQAFATLLRELKLAPQSFEIAAFSLLRLLKRGPFDTSGVNLIAHVNESSSEITVIDNGILKLTRNIDVPLSGSAVHAGHWTDRETAFPPSFAAIRDLLSEVERLMNFYYYTFNKETDPFLRIYVSGGVPLLPAIVNDMAERFSQQVHLIDWKQLQPEGAEALHVPAYAAALGLALRGGDR